MSLYAGAAARRGIERYSIDEPAQVANVRHRMGRRLILVVACALLVAGCGGKSKPHVLGAVYGRTPTAACLRAKGFKVSTKERDINFIAYAAPGGGLRARKKGVDLIIAFGLNGNDRHQIMVAVKRFARRPPIFRYRIGRANIVILWAYRPSPKNKAILDKCLARQTGKPA